MSRPGWVNAYQAGQPSLGPVVVCDGNSITAGAGASDAAHRYPNQLATILGGTWTMVNTGTSAETTQNRINVAATNILANLNLKRSKNVAILWEATNDMYYWIVGGTPPSGAIVPASLAAVEANTVAWCALARTYDFKVIVAPIMPRSNAPMSAGNITTFAAQRALYNAWLLANWTTFADGYVALPVGMSADGDEAGANFSGDLVHPSDAGHLLLAQAFAPTVAAMVWP